MTPSELQAAIDHALPGGTVAIPPGVHRWDAGSTVYISRPVVIEAAGATIEVVGDQVGRWGMFSAPDLAGGRLAFRGLTIVGPPTTGWTAGRLGAAIDWVRAKTPTGDMRIENVTITGGWDAAVTRSGGGTVTVSNSHLEGWEAALKVFESHNNGGGQVTVCDSDLVTPAGGASTGSIGMYVHPHISCSISRVQMAGWHRYGLYLNGSMSGDGVAHQMFKVTADGCSLIQAGSGDTSITLTGCAEKGAPKNGGSLLRGRVASCGTTWSGSGSWALENSAADHHLTFVGDTIVRPEGWWGMVGRRSTGRISMVDCRAELGERGRGLLVIPDPDQRWQTLVADLVTDVPSTRQAPPTMSIGRGALHVVGRLPPGSVVNVAPQPA